MREQDGPLVIKELVEVHVAMGSLRLEIWRYIQSALLSEPSLSTLNIPIEPNLSLGCSAGSAIPRRSSGVAGRWNCNAGRAEERRAREAARGKKEAILSVPADELSVRRDSGVVVKASMAAKCISKSKFWEWRHVVLKGPVGPKSATPAFTSYRHDTLSFAPYIEFVIQV